MRRIARLLWFCLSGRVLVAGVVRLAAGRGGRGVGARLGLRGAVRPEE